MLIKFGMKKFIDLYLLIVRLFDDFFLVEYCEKLKLKFMVVIGVCKMVDFDIIFLCFLNFVVEIGYCKWSYLELIKYFILV